MSKSNENYLHILEAEIVNFKNFTTKHVDIGGKTLIITGPNGEGKSSLIQAICSSVDSKYMPLEPIKKGEESGMVKIRVGGKVDGEEAEYTISTHFSQEHKRGRLSIQDAEGTSVKGNEKSILSSIVGNIGFDIMEFVRLAKTDGGAISLAGVKKQIEIIKQLIDKESINKIDLLDIEKKKIYDERAEINREIKYIKKDISENKMSQEEILKYSEKQLVEEVNKELEKANLLNKNIDASNSFMLKVDKVNETLEEEIKELELEIQRKKTGVQENKAKKAEVQKFLDGKGKVRADISKIQEKLDSISDHNSKFETIQSMIKKNEKLSKKEKESSGITNRLTEIDTEKKSLFTSAKMPVKGLEFNDECVTFNDLPLSDDQIPTSTLIGIGVKIGMALNPKLRVMVIRDGSLLGNKILKGILDICSKKNYQLIIERVNPDDDSNMEIEFIER